MNEDVLIDSLSADLYASLSSNLSVTKAETK